ncbi:MAG: chemotaxis protein CheB, partial [Magnetospirillum sp.]
ERPVPGRVYVAPIEKHIALIHGRLAIVDTPAVCGQKPSGTVLFSSLARALGNKAVGVVLTGMGADGSEGLNDMYKAGGYTIAEDSSTCVVFGMPSAAAKIGAVREMLPLPAISGRLRDLAGAGGAA